MTELESLKNFVKNKLCTEDYAQFEELLEAYIETEYTVGLNVNSVKFYNPFLSTEEAQKILDQIDFVGAVGAYNYIEIAELVQNTLPQAQIEYIKAKLVDIYGKDIYAHFFLDSDIAELFLENPDYNDPTMWATLEMTLEEYNPTVELQEFVYQYIQELSSIEQEKFYLMWEKKTS